MTSCGLVLQTEHWYGWQMVPGYFGERNVPYFSPIFVRRIRPLKTGRRDLRLDFLNVLYAKGVQDFSLDLRVAVHAADYLVAEIQMPRGGPRRAAIISHIEFEWVRRFCPELWNAQPPESFSSYEQTSVSAYLDALFGPAA